MTTIWYILATARGSVG